MIILSFNTTTKTYEKEQRTEIVAGSKDTIQLRVRFGTYEEGQFVHDFDYARGSKYQVGVIFVRPDGEETWFIPLSLQSDGYFLGVLEGWVLRKSGELKVRILNKNIDDNTAEAFIQVLLPILEGTSLDDVDFSFGEMEYDAILNSISNINYNLTRKADLDENNKVPPEQLYETAFLPEGVMFYKGKIGADEIPKRSEEHFLSFKVINKQTGETEPLSAYGIYSFLFDIYSENTEVSELREDGIPIQKGYVGWHYDLGDNFTFGAGNTWMFMVFNDRISFNKDVIKDDSTYEIDFKSLIHIQKGTVYTVIDSFTLNDVDYEAGTNIFWDGTEWRVLGAGGGKITVETWNTATKTLALSDSNKLFKCSHTDNQTLTIPTNEDIAFPIGTMITFLLTSTYTVTFVGASGVTLTSIDSLVELATQFAMASLIKTDTNTWQLVGVLE